eukprot:1161902-Pelagomonas_calceolata.AAC.5
MQVAEAKAHADKSIRRAEELAAEVMEKAQAEMARATLEARIGTVPEAALSQAMAQAQAKVSTELECQGFCEKAGLSWATLVAS